MNVMVLQVFVTLMLVAGGLVLLAYSTKHSDVDHADRLSLLPVEDDERPATKAAAAPSGSEPNASDAPSQPA